MMIMSIPCWSAKGYLRASHHNVYARMLGASYTGQGAMSRLGVASELNTRLRSARYLILKIRPTQDFFQSGSVYVLAYSSRVPV